MRRNKPSTRTPKLAQKSKYRNLTTIAIIHAVLFFFIVWTTYPEEYYFTTEGTPQNWQACGPKGICARGIEINNIHFSCTYNPLASNFDCPVFQTKESTTKAVYLCDKSLASQLFKNPPKGILVELSQEKKILHQNTFAEISSGYKKRLIYPLALILTSLYFTSTSSLALRRK